MTNNTLSSKIQILCADGHQDTCSFLIYLLKPFGYKVTTVNDMSNGLKIARAVNCDLYTSISELSGPLCGLIREKRQ